ncbi:hypothetical protein HAX54_041252 [Datura stramonium]|uniref:Uncharacterized protein n=1 Tax=Datura stramonium TaxID=4076 RepID=A0ABS8VNS6_DATST|nr:hypothetical protein [Datura stramonium]
MSSFGGWSQDPEGMPCAETIKLVDKMWRREGKKDAMLLVMMKQMELLKNYMKGFHARYHQDNYGYEYAYNGNLGWKNVWSVDMSIQESDESVPPHMESTLKVVLEKVLSTKKGMQDLLSKLLDLTTTVKSHDVIIQQLEDRMNELASQVESQKT